MKTHNCAGMQLYLCHPYGSFGTVKDNRRREAVIAHRLERIFDVKLIRPLNEIDPTTPRNQAVAEGLSLLRKSQGIILSGMWRKSVGCVNELLEAKKLGLPVYEFKNSELTAVNPTDEFLNNIEIYKDGGNQC